MIRSIAICWLAAVLATAGCSEATEQPAASPYLVKDIEVVWQRYVKDGNTCNRCDQTGRNIQRTVEQLNKELAPDGVEISFITKELGEEEIPESNRVFVNGEPIECTVPGVRVYMNDCESCCGMASGKGVKCRAIEYNGRQSDELPEELIRSAILAVARNLPRPEPPVPVPGKPDSPGGCGG